MFFDDDYEFRRNHLNSLSSPMDVGIAIAGHMVEVQKEMPEADEGTLAKETLLRLLSFLVMSDKEMKAKTQKIEKRKRPIKIWDLPEHAFNIVNSRMPDDGPMEEASCRAILMDTLFNRQFRYAHLPDFAREMAFLETANALFVEESGKSAFNPELSRAIFWYAMRPEISRRRNLTEARYLGILGGKLPAETGLVSVWEEVASSPFGIKKLQESQPMKVTASAARVLLRSFRPNRDVAYYAHLFGWVFESGVDPALGQVWTLLVDGVELVLVPEVKTRKTKEDSEVKFVVNGPFGFMVYYESMDMMMGSVRMVGLTDEGGISEVQDPSGNWFRVVSPTRNNMEG